MRRVAIIGSAQTKHEARKAESNVEDMVYETVSSLLAAAGLEADSIDTVIGAGDDVLDGRSISNVFTAEYAGAFLKEESKVEDDGAFAAFYAFTRLASGGFDTAVVYAYSKASDSSPQYYAGMIADPFYLRPLGLEALTSAALQARCYFDRYSVTESDAAMVAVKNRRHGLTNPAAQLRSPVTAEEVLGSSPLAEPIKLLDAAPATDGCCALLLASEDAVRRLDCRPAWIRGVSLCTDSYYPGFRDLTRIRSAAIAASRAYKMAGIHDPAKDIDVAELVEQFSYQELMLYEALGFCDRGKGGELIRSGVTDLHSGGSLPVNPSGGALCANPIMAAGLIRLAEAANRVAGHNDRPDPTARTAVAHATSGFCLQSNIVYVLGGTPNAG